MFSFITGSDPKTKNDTDARRPINEKDRKQAKIFSKGVTRFLRYNKDLLSEDKFNEIATKRHEFLELAHNTSKLRKDLDDMSEGISKICKKAIPDFQPSMLKENIEVLFVAVVIAMGIRAYFVQQFKIPTGSMQPTLNGIIAYPAREIASMETEYSAPVDYKKPNPVKRLIDSVWFGRSHVEWRAKEDGDSFINQGISDKNLFVLFPRTYLKTKLGHKYAASGTRDRVERLIDFRLTNNPLKKGDVIARGYLQTGDMLIVNKMVYHWRKPKRGEVFVFHTRGIQGIQNSSSTASSREGRRLTIEQAYGSQHYIKRLVGVPHDHLKIEPPRLIINGEDAKEFGIKRVASKEGRYTGYLNAMTNEFNLNSGEYLAFGDNSASSSDSRYWGTVKEPNIVGRAMFVFFPFGNHFGSIR